MLHKSLKIALLGAFALSLTPLAEAKITNAYAKALREKVEQASQISTGTILMCTATIAAAAFTAALIKHDLSVPGGPHILGKANFSENLQDVLIYGAPWAGILAALSIKCGLQLANYNLDSVIDK